MPINDWINYTKKNPYDTVFSLKVGDIIITHDPDDMASTFQELSKAGYEVEFLYEHNGEKGYYLEILEVPKE